MILLRKERDSLKEQQDLENMNWQEYGLEDAG